MHDEVLNPGAIAGTIEIEIAKPDDETMGHSDSASAANSKGNGRTDTCPIVPIAL